MISMLREKLAFLAQELGDQLYYELQISTSAPRDSWGTQSEQHRLSIKGYKTVRVVSAGQVMKLTKADFIADAPEVKNDDSL